MPMRALNVFDIKMQSLECFTIEYVSFGSCWEAWGSVWKNWAQVINFFLSKKPYFYRLEKFQQIYLQTFRRWVSDLSRLQRSDSQRLYYNGYFDFAMDSLTVWDRLRNVRRFQFGTSEEPWNSRVLNVRRSDRPREYFWTFRDHVLRTSELLQKTHFSPSVGNLRFCESMDMVESSCLTFAINWI